MQGVHMLHPEVYPQPTQSLITKKTTRFVLEKSLEEEVPRDTRTQGETISSTHLASRKGWKQSGPPRVTELTAWLPRTSGFLVRDSLTNPKSSADCKQRKQPATVLVL